jgi:hypothetical protein
MLKKFLKCTALICVMSLTFSLYGCSDTSWAVKVGNTTMPSGVYLYFLTGVSQNIVQSVSSGVDPWSQTYSGSNITVIATNYALNQTKQCAEIENLCAKMKIISTVNDKNSAISFASGQMSANSATYSNNGISSTSLQQIYQDLGVLSDKLFTALYSKGGTLAVSDTDLKKFSSDYVRIKHIVLLTSDSSGTALTGDALAKVTKTANDVLTAAQAKDANFDQLMVQYSQDLDKNGTPNSPTGYLFTKASAATTGYDTTFVDTAFGMKIGEIKLIKASYGYDIMTRLDLDNGTMLYTMKSADFTKYLQDQFTKDKGVANDAAINHYNPKNLK